VPLVPYVAATVDEVGPKSLPVSVTLSLPPVDRALPPLRPLIAGAVYAVVSVDAALAWAPTVTIHFNAVPVPTPLAHWICVFATVTLHAPELMPVPAVPYVAVTV